MNASPQEEASEVYLDHSERVTTLSRDVRVWAHRHMTWLAKAAMVARVYQWVRAKEGDIPRFL